MKRNNHKYFFFLFLIVWSCRSTYVVVDQPKANLIDYSNATPDTSLQNLIKPFQQKQDSIMNHVVGYLGEDMEKGYPEGKLGNFIADVLFEQTISKNSKFNASNSFCLINNGGLRVPMQAGKVTRGKVFELMPFENAISVVQLKGAVLQKEMIEYLVAKKGQPVSFNVQIQISDNKLESLKINNTQLDTSAYYYVITSDYLSGGGDNMTFFKKGTLVQGDFNQYKLRDMILEYFEKNTSELKPGYSIGFGRMKLGK